MSKIQGTKHGDNLQGKSGGDEISGLGGDDKIVGNERGGQEMLVGGSFETAKINPNSWGTVKTVGGWQTDSSIEVWGKSFLGVKATDGDKIVELDSDKQLLSRFWQDVQTEAGKSYDFSFDYAARANTALWTNTIEVYWNGQKVGAFDPVSGNWSKGALTLVGTGGLDRLEFREEKSDNDSLGGLIDNVSLKVAGRGADTLFGSAGNDHIDGLGGDDVIFGGSKPTSKEPTKAVTAADNDEIHAGDGNDTAYGNNGDDKIYGDAGHDALFGGRGNDVIDGGTGNDKLFGDSGNDTISDGSGNDHVSAGSGDDRVIAGTGDDTYLGGKGFDVLSFYDVKSGVKVDLSKHVATGAGKDSIYGFESVEGSSFDDEFKGSKHDDVLSGGAGNDVLRGLGGADVLTGGDGSDVFVWKVSDLKQQLAGKGGVDRVTDFSKEDRLDLSDLTQGMTMDEIMKTVAVKDDGVNSHLYVDLGGGFHEVAVLENFTGHTVSDMLAEGMIMN